MCARDIVVGTQSCHFFLRGWRIGNSISQIALPFGFYEIWKAKYKETQEQMEDVKFAVASEQAPFGAAGCCQWLLTIPILPDFPNPPDLCPIPRVM